MSKIQILKAIHNVMDNDPDVSDAVYDVKDTNFESNSQLFNLSNVAVVGCL